MNSIKIVFIFQLVALFIGLADAHSANSCPDLFPSAGSKRKLTDYFYKESDSNRSINVSKEWIHTYNVVKQTLEKPGNREIFLNMLPGKKLELKPAKDSILYETKDEELVFAENLFHLTKPKVAAKIIQTQTPMLTGGSHNSAAFCLGAPNFFRANGKSVQTATYLRVKINPDAKVLNLAKYPLGQPDPDGYAKQVRVV